MEFFSHIFGFNSESPLLFTQFYFWAFFALVYAVFAMIMEVGAHSAQARRREGERQEYAFALPQYLPDGGELVLLLQDQRHVPAYSAICYPQRLAHRAADI